MTSRPPSERLDTDRPCLAVALIVYGIFIGFILAASMHV